MSYNTSFIRTTTKTTDKIKKLETTIAHPSAFFLFMPTAMFFNLIVKCLITVTTS